MSEKPTYTQTFNEDLDIDQLLHEGGFLARWYLEVQSNDKKVAEEALKNMIFNNLMNEPEAQILEVSLYDLKKESSGEDSEYYSGVAEIKLITTDFRWFINLVMRYAPSAIEVIEPEEVKLSSDQIHAILADVSEISHAYSTQIMSMLKEDERRELYNRMLGIKREEK